MKFARMKLAACMQLARIQPWACMRLAAICVTALSPGIAASAGFHAATEVISERRSAYRNVLVTEGGGYRCLKFGRQHAFQSCIEIGAPERLVLGYTRAMLAAAALHPAPRRVLLIGLGAGVIPRALHRAFPRIEVTAIELDPVVVEAAQRSFGFSPAATDTVQVADGRMAVRARVRAAERYDLVMIDAFERDYIPEHLLTVEFLAQIRELLDRDGLVIANTWANTALSRYESATYAAAFGDTIDLMTAGGNRILIAARDALPAHAALQKRIMEAHERLAPLGIDVGEMSLALGATPRHEGVRALSDRFAPANLLLLRGGSD